MKQNDSIQDDEDALVDYSHFIHHAKIIAEVLRRQMTGSRPQSAPPTTPTPNLPPEFDYEAYFDTNIEYLIHLMLLFYFIVTFR